MGKMVIDIKSMPKLGFGLMRLPETDGKIDMGEVCRMVDLYMDAGLNYFDTAYVYHGGMSEVAAKDAHSVEDGGNYDTYEKYDCFGWGLQKKAEGKIRHFGFSYHGSPELLEKILDKHPETEFVQIQLNYADWNNPVVRSGELYEILSLRNIPMIIMEPVKGGSLAKLAPELEAKYKAVRPDASIASWALRFVASLPGVMTILSGMTHEDQMQDNIRTFTDFEPLSEKEKIVVDEVTKIMLNIPQIGCTACRYCCDGCPKKISIPDVFRIVNTIRLYHEEFRPKSFYNSLTGYSGKASDCIGCGQCEKVCPQHLKVIQFMNEAAGMLDT